MCTLKNLLNKFFDCYQLSYNYIKDYSWTGSILSPTSAQVLEPLSLTSQSMAVTTAESKQANLGATWSNSGNLNIDVDNLFTSKQHKQGGAPSMNQLASNPTSPTNQPKMMAPSHSMPTFSAQHNFNAIPLVPGYPHPVINQNLMTMNTQHSFPTFK